MIIKTNKADALQLIKTATHRLADETYLQCNMVGSDWLFIIANAHQYIKVHTDRMRNQFQIEVTNQHTERTISDVYNVTRPTSQAIHDYFVELQSKYIYGI